MGKPVGGHDLIVERALRGLSVHSASHSLDMYMLVRGRTYVFSALCVGALVACTSACAYGIYACTYVCLCIDVGVLAICHVYVCGVGNVVHTCVCVFLICACLCAM